MAQTYDEGEILADGTEQQIAIIADLGQFRLHLDMINAVALDIVIVVRAKLQVGDSSISEPNTVYLGTFRGHGGTPIVIAVEPLSNVRVLEYSIIQTAGSFVSFPWEVVQEIGNQVVLDAVNAIGSGTGGALPFPMASDNTVSPIQGVPFVGSVATGDITDTYSANFQYFQINDDANIIDIVFELNVLGFRTATKCVFTGFLNGGNDFMLVQTYNWQTIGWDDIGILDGISGSSNTVQDFNMFLPHTGKGADSGRVLIRIVTTGSPSNPDLNIDSLIVEALNTSISVGYQNGAIWINTDGGQSGSQLGTNGTADNPVDNLADAILLGAALGTSRFEVIANSDITFLEAHDDEVWSGTSWTLNLNGQSISNTDITGATRIDGLAVAAERPAFRGCGLGNVQLPPSFFNACGLLGLFQVAAPGSFDLVACEAFNSGDDAPSFDLGSGFSGSEMNLTGWSGDVDFANISAEDSVPDEVAIQGIGGKIEFNGSGGSIAMRGIYEQVVDNSAQAVSSVQTGVLNRTGIQGYDNGLVYIDGTITNESTIPYVDGTADRAVSTLAAAREISTKVGIRGFRLKEGTDIVLDMNYDNYPFDGPGGTIDLNGQSVVGARFSQVIISGASAVGTGLTVCRDHLLVGVTMRNQFAGLGVRFEGTTILDAPVLFPFADASFDETAEFVFANADAVLEVNTFTDRAELRGMTANNKARIHGSGTITINVDCTGGELEYSGDVTVIDNSGNVALNPGLIARTNVDTSVTLPNIINDVSIQRNTADQFFHVLMVLASDHVTPAPGLTLSGQRLLDNGAYESLTGSFVEAGSGMYKFLPSQADTNGKLVSWRFTAATADDRTVTFFTLP